MIELDGLRGGLIVSVQAWAGSAIDDPRVLAAMAHAAVLNGAVAVRMQGVANILAARERISAPIVGLIKREYPGFDPYITSTADEVRDVLRAGADVVALDATLRPRPHGEHLRELIATIHAGGCLAMADCATVDDARRAAAEGADIVATTLCGYTKETQGTPLPAFGLLEQMSQCDAFVVCEGGVATPRQVRDALARGADAVVVGTAITNVDWLVREFVAATDKGTPS